MLRMPHEDGWVGQPLASSEEFEAYAGGWGGVARGQEFSPEMYRLHQEFGVAVLLWDTMAKSRGPNAFGQPFKSHFGFVDNEEPDAFADLVDGVHYCGMNTGLVRIAFYLGDQIFLLRDVVPGLGGRVKPMATGNLTLFPNQDELEQSESLTLEGLLQAKRKRRVARDYFAHFLVAFSIYHEFNHAISGHSAYAAQRWGFSRLHEIGTRSADDLSSDMHQEIEYVADNGAVETMFEYVNSGSIMRKISRAKLPPHTLHHIFLIALSVLCAQWAGMNRKYGADGFHPQPAARWAACLRLYTVFLQANYPFGIWNMIGKAAVRDVATLALECRDVLDLMNQLHEFGPDSSYWPQRQPESYIVDLNEIRSFGHPPLIAPKPYKDRTLRTVIKS